MLHIFVLICRLPWVTADEKVEKLFLYHLHDVIKHKDYLIQEVCTPTNIEKSIEIYINHEGKQGISATRNGKYYEQISLAMLIGDLETF